MRARSLNGGSTSSVAAVRVNLPGFGARYQVKRPSQSAHCGYFHRALFDFVEQQVVPLHRVLNFFDYFFELISDCLSIISLGHNRNSLCLWASKNRPFSRYERLG